MLYEVRTYTLRPGGIPEFERTFAEALPHREKYSKLGAFWHTEFGPQNQVIHVWPYEDLAERTRVRAEASQDPHWPPKNDPNIYRDMQSEIFLPAEGSPPLGGDQALGNIYEMRIYTYKVGSMPEVIKRWEAAIPHRVPYSPIAAAWYSELGKLNVWVHIWPYQSLEHRAEVRAKARENPNWPPPTGEFLLSEENKLLEPSAFSPMH